MLGDSSRLDSFHTLSPRFLTWRIFLCHIFIYLSQSFQLLIWCTMMYLLNFCPRNRGALGNQMMLSRPMGQQSPNIANMCVSLKTSWFLSVLLNGVLHGLAALNLRVFGKQSSTEPRRLAFKHAEILRLRQTGCQLPPPMSLHVTCLTGS